MSAAMALSERDWQLRAQIYARTVASGRPPAAAEMARENGESEATVRAAYRRLHDAHQLLLADDDRILMANPLAGQPTDYTVYLKDGRRLWANCAWDAAGVCALLGEDGEIRARHPNSGEELRFAVVAGELRAPPWLVHFSLPVRRWYDDLIHT